MEKEKEISIISTGSEIETWDTNYFKAPIRELTGEVINGWKIIKRLPSSKDGVQYLCQCPCGKESIKSASLIANRMPEMCLSCTKKKMRKKRTYIKDLYS